MKNQIKAVVNAILSHNAGEYVYSDVKQLFADVANNFDNDFNVDFDGREYRVISNDDILDIMKDELSSDTYVLGCGSDWFMSDVTGIPVDAIRKIQDADVYEALGIIIANNDEMLTKFAEGIISHDGAGNHFSAYDFSETEAGEYTVFCVN
ncbi:hypothetical protein BNCALIDO_00181 [Aeromonas phage vB_AdhM_TS9]|nr:hypothetical protein BNCALIDO_00181 [Aeromonas phage vB_AdhM_TS9]